jgi:phosphoribosyl 1,2-cyclic phosphodiesterase
VKVRFWGVRGSIPVPGLETSRYGGNSSCLEVQSPGAPPLVLDCGTGARNLGRRLVERRTEKVYVLFTHFHMDHLFGFPFFGPIYSPSCRVQVGVPAYSGVDAQAKLGRYLNGIYHPMRLQEVGANIEFQGIRPGRSFELGPYQIQGIPLNHPGGATGYRISDGRHAVAYITDTAPMSSPDKGISADLEPPPPERRLLQAVGGSDLVVMDTMFSRDEYLLKMTWGHGYPEYAHKLAVTAGGVKRLALFHHSPDATDDDLDQLAAHWAGNSKPEVFVAKEGQVVDLEG